MCGIAGLLYFDPGRAVDPALLDRMTDVLAHRGPDGRGTHIDGPLGLGHRRLAIIDLSPDAAQPLSNEDGSVWVVLNGEIYNFQALREELLAKGHTFRSRSDTEVLVHLYEEVGDALVDRLRGMFAFAIWDARARRLLLARDRFGQKPLYYRLDERGIHFASEIKGILRDPEVTRSPDPGALHDFLAYGYVPGPATAFSGIRKLEPGHTLSVEADGRQALRQYWRLACAPKRAVADTPADRARVEEELLELLDEATRLRMISDVPLGAFLSGGVDSSAIVASMCASSTAHDVKTFAIGFDEAAWDESAHAERVARHLATDHRALTLMPDAGVDLERIAWHYGEPFADPSCLPTFAVSKLAREHVTVVLSGDGGDELFLGYRRYQGIRLEERLRAGPGTVRLLGRNRYLIHSLYRLATLRPGSSGRTRDLAEELALNRLDAARGLADVYLRRMEVLSPELRASLYADAFRAAASGRDTRQRLSSRIAASDGETFTERCAHGDALTYLPDDILVKVDIASMAHGLECRAPFLDHRLAEFAARLPFGLKLDGQQTKAVLKRAVRHRLPGATLARRKQGFGVPLEHWLRGGFSGLLNEYVLSPRSLQRGYFRPAAVRRLVDEHTAGRQNHQRLLFSLVMLELWQRTCVEGDFA